MKIYFKKLNYDNTEVILTLNEENQMMLITEDDYIASPTAYINCKHEDNEIFIKMHRENECMLKWLIDNKIVKEVRGFVFNGYEDFPIGIIDLNEFKEDN